jgi:hypothetical protein
MSASVASYFRCIIWRLIYSIISSYERNGHLQVSIVDYFTARWAAILEVGAPLMGFANRARATEVSTSEEYSPAEECN